MNTFKTRKQYEQGFTEILGKVSKNVDDLYIYLKQQLNNFDQLVDQLNNKNFWEIYPLILGIDARLGLLIDLVNIDDLSNFEIIRIIENDYKYYLKELCGYELSAKTKHQMVFNVV